MKIYSASITEYASDGWTNTTKELVEPDWDLIKRELLTMDRHTKPLIWLCAKIDSADKEALAICGGNNVWHVSICLAGEWHQYYDINGSTDELAVWTSDQGFTTTQNNLVFNEDLVLKIVKYYYENATYDPEIPWEGINA